ncbi:unnamed protein product [Closterium sp. Naga37s-1]|nr:unnamed protein product [Closterium sp. Naga37s-1]
MEPRRKLSPSLSPLFLLLPFQITRGGARFSEERGVYYHPFSSFSSPPPADCGRRNAAADKESSLTKMCHAEEQQLQIYCDGRTDRRNDWPPAAPSLLFLFRSIVLKACLGLVKVLSVRLEAADLEAHLPVIMTALLSTNEIVATQFKAKEVARAAKAKEKKREVARAAKAKEKKRVGAGARGGSQAGNGEEGGDERLGGVEGGRRGGSLAGDVKEGGDGRSTMSGEVSERVKPLEPVSDTSADGDSSDDEDYSDADEDKRSMFDGNAPPSQRLAMTVAWGVGYGVMGVGSSLTEQLHLMACASKKAQHGRPQLHERITETGGDTPLDLLDLAGTRRALSAPLLKPTHGTLSSGATGGGAGGGGSKRHRDGGGEREGERKDAGFEYTEDGKMDVLNETEGGEGGTGGGSGRKGGAKKGVGAGEDDGEGNLDYGVMEDDDVAMGDASLASARAAELAFGRRVHGARGAKGGGEGGEGRGGAGAGGGGGRKKAKANSGQARPFLLVRTGAVGRSRLVAVAGGHIQGMNMPQAAGGVRAAM